MKNKQNIVFLFTELSGYFIACVKELSKTVDVHIVHWPINQEAPFKFSTEDGVFLYNRLEYSNSRLELLVKQINPSRLICTGWIDKGYLYIAKTYKNKIPTVITLDNHWTGSVKQKLFVFFGRWYLHARFSHIWIPGAPQKEYANRLGFSKQQVLDGYYSADSNYFSHLNSEELFLKRFEQKTFVFIGRYIESKGIEDLWTAFCMLKNTIPSTWKLVCIGTGSLYSQKIIHSDIEHLGFMQPNELSNILTKATFFVLPSRFEPWGVVVHEMACAGIPVICSDQVGSASLFVEDNTSGFIFPSSNITELYEKLELASKMTEDTYVSFCRKAHDYSKQISVDRWCKTILDVAL